MFSVPWYDQTCVPTGIPLGVLVILGGALGLFLVVEKFDLLGTSELKSARNVAVRKRRKKK